MPAGLQVEQIPETALKWQPEEEMRAQVLEIKSA